MLAQRDSLRVLEFSGCNDLIDSIKLPPSLVSYSHGGFYTERGEFKKLPGKLAASSASSLGSILAIQQVFFDKRSLVIFHSSTSFWAEDCLDPLVSEGIVLNPMGTLIE